ncbi:MAG: YicC family protein [Bacteriovoracaceae bacterium]|nr:YicC family protein [Bacteriovoracaceae bacterium]
MMQSMTGFAREEKRLEPYQIGIEIKSVNHRFKEIRFRMNHELSFLEMSMRKKIEQSFGRGSFDIYVKVTREDKVQGISLQEEMATNFLQKLKKISQDTAVPLHFSPSDLLRQEFLEEAPKDYQLLQEQILQIFDMVVDKLLLVRQEEGKKLELKIKEYLGHFSQGYLKIANLVKENHQSLRDSLLKKLQDIKGQIDENRLAQEMIYYLEKWDIAEEVQRITIHLEKVADVFKQEKDRGKQMEFWLQELGRETNTIGSKSTLAEVSALVVQMKMALEKMREQMANLE